MREALSAMTTRCRAFLAAGITAAVCAILLGHEDLLRIGALLEAVPLSQPALSRLVARLVERDLVVRTTAADDGRAVLVRLTETGRDLADRAINVHAQSVEEVLISRLTEREQTSLLTTLDRITTDTGPD